MKVHKSPQTNSVAKKALTQFAEAARSAPAKKVDKLADHAIDTFMHRAGTPDEVAALRAETTRLIKHDKSNTEIATRLQSELAAKPEAQAINQVVGASQSLLGHDNVDPAWVEQARTLSQQGKTTTEIRTATEASIKAGEDYRRRHMADTVDASYQTALGRLPTREQRLAGVAIARPLIDQHATADAVNQALAADIATKFGSTPAYRSFHAGDTVNAAYQASLGRPANPKLDSDHPEVSELQGAVDQVTQLIAQGKSPDEVNAALDFGLAQLPEFKARQDALQRQSILDVAQGEIGTLEATNNNDGDVAKYPGFFGRGAQSYCANFASYVLSHAGIPTDFFNTETMKNAFVEQGKWKGLNDPKPGDLVWFDWGHDGGTDHVGIVKGVNADGTIRTIEGNTGGPGGQEGVWEQDRPLDLINGFANPN